MDSRNITRERLTDCISILLDVDDATHREYGDLITRMITLLQDMRNSMPTEAERIKAKFAELSAKMADEVYGKRANTAIEASSAPSPEGGNAGARYVPKRHETSKFRYCVWDTETEIALQIEGENFLWTTLPRVKRECARLNASKRYVVQTETADVMFPLSKIVDTETMTELDGVYIDIETANGECSRLNGKSS